MLIVISVNSQQPYEGVMLLLDTFTLDPAQRARHRRPGQHPIVQRKS